MGRLKRETEDVNRLEDLIKLDSSPNAYCIRVQVVSRPLLRASEIIDGESVAIKDGVFGCEGQGGAAWRVLGCDEACGQREVSRSFQS
jgi:hypothetical protein